MEFIIILFLLILNGIFAMYEIALVSSSKARLETLVNKGQKSAKGVLKQLEEPEKFLSTIQIGITLIGIISGAYGGVAIADDVVPLFAMIPGLEHAEFVRYGVMHRNTFLESPKVLTKQQFLKEHTNVFFAGQITGFEGYMESAASGLLAAHQMLARLKDRELPPPPAATMCGALLDYITTPNKDFQPMGANMGILPRTEEINIIRDKRERYMALSQAAQDAMQAWVKEYEA